MTNDLTSWEGATRDVEEPMSTAHQASTASDASNDSQVLHAKHAPLLIVDDDGDIRDTMRVFFESEGHVVAEADSTAAALRYLRRARKPHMVLLDFLMPAENADVLLGAVAQDTVLRRHCYLLMSATPRTCFSEEAQGLIATLCAEVLLKPFDLADLLAAVAHAEAQVSGGAQAGPPSP